MPRIARSTLLERFRAKIAAGRPIVGGGAGTGLSAKCEEAGGIDLIVIYNSGRYRMAGRGSLAGLAGLRQRQRDRLRDGARGAAGGEAHAGAGGRQRHRPVHDPRRVPAAADRPRLLRHPELPDRRPDRRHLPREPRGDRHGLRARGRADRARTRARPADHALRLQRSRRARDGRRRRRHRRVPPGPHHRRRDRRGNRAHARRLRAAHQRVGGGRARGEPRGDRAVPRRPDRDARGRAARAGAVPRLPRLLRRELDGAPAGRGGAHRDDATLRSDHADNQRRRHP